MTTTPTTKELNKFHSALLKKVSQHLRELDKPDCIYTLCADDSPTPHTLESSCDGGVLWYMGNPGENKLPKFCWHCGGAVKAKDTQLTSLDEMVKLGQEMGLYN